MAMAGKMKLVFALMGATALAGCEEGQEFKPFGKPLFGGNAAGDAGGDVAASSTTTIEKDVEAPEVFQQTENGLWDGRPSLGGVWVAHPDVVDPERAIIRNQANGKFIIGALFRRERENPGPRFQVSSDAASELGMAAGTPAELNVTVLRREEIAVAPPVATPTVDTLDDGGTIEQATLEPVDTAPVSESTDATDPAPATEAADPVANMAATAIAAATAGTGDAQPAPSGAAATTAPAVAPVAAPASTLSKPFVQIGIFSVQSNATETADLLRGAGVVPTTKTFSSAGKKYWRVIIGPAASSSERSTLISKAKELGFADAYAVTN